MFISGKRDVIDDMSSSSSQKLKLKKSSPGASVQTHRASGGQHHNKSVQYSSGEPAIVFDQDGCGFCYYKSGRVAICISKVNAYQRRYYAYEDNRHKTLVFSLDEHVCGTAMTPSGSKCILTKTSGMITDEDQNIIQTWRREGSGGGGGKTNLVSPVHFQLNASLAFSFRNRDQVSLVFKNEGLVLELDCSEKVKREDKYSTYLDHAVRVTSGPKRGQLELPQIRSTAPSLIERQSSRSKTNEASHSASSNPSRKITSSESISNPEIQALMANLERKFDSYDQGHRVQPSSEPGWKEQAQDWTRSQVPVPTGSKLLYPNSNSNSNSNAPNRTSNKGQLQNDKGEWLGSVELHHRLMTEHPILPRSTGLSNASGRYSAELKVVLGGHVNAIAPKLPLVRLTTSNFHSYLRNQCVDRLVVVVCLREDNRACRDAEVVCEMVNHTLRSSSSSESSESKAAAEVVKFDMASCATFMKDQYDVQALPTFLFFYNTQLVHISALGGKKVRVHPSTRNAALGHLMPHLPQTLLIESRVKNQLLFEKSLRNQDFDWHLALNANQALSMMAEAKSTATVPGLILLESKAYSQEIQRWASAHPKTVVAVIVSVVNEQLSGQPKTRYSKHVCVRCRVASGRSTSDPSVLPKPDQVCPRCGVILNRPFLLTAPSHRLRQQPQQPNTIEIYQTLKAATLHRLAERWHEMRKSDDDDDDTSQSSSFKGLTRHSLLRQIQECVVDAERGRVLSTDVKRPMTLSAIETRCRGVDLVQQQPPHGGR